jgi:hypothetical protein
MNKKIGFIWLLFFCSNAKSQWNSYCYFDTYYSTISWVTNGTFRDTDFIDDVTQMSVQALIYIMTPG